MKVINFLLAFLIIFLPYFNVQDVESKTKNDQSLVIMKGDTSVNMNFNVEVKTESVKISNFDVFNSSLDKLYTRDSATISSFITAMSNHTKHISDCNINNKLIFSKLPFSIEEVPKLIDNHNSINKIISIIFILVAIISIVLWLIYRQFIELKEIIIYGFFLLFIYSILPEIIRVFYDYNYTYIHLLFSG